ncbi:MFS transporter [Facilibium subflavum]|uniref:MFS transporter n=1 Tax=Facilibium subflavum TaxID=2219058 RepID=UPI000E65BB73|nr:MFS transporter [Facilibium subflavum]
MLKSDRKTILFIQALLILMLTQLSTDIYLPSIPEMAKDLSSNLSTIKLSMTAMIFSLGASQLISGALSDVYGRRKIALYGLLIFCCGSMVLILPTNSIIMIIGRLIQGIGLGFGLSFSSCVSGDLYKGKTLNIALSVISIAYAVMPVVAPLMGGFIQVHYNWKLSFVVLLIFGIACLMMIKISFIETNENMSKRFSISGLYADYKACLGNVVYVRHLLLAALIYAVEVSYIIQMPIIVQTQFNATPVFAASLVFFTSLAIVVGSALSGVLLRIISPDRIIRLSVVIALLFILFWLFSVIVFSAKVFIMVVAMSGIMLSSGLIFPNAIAKCIELFQTKAGLSSSLAIGILTSIGGIITVFVSLLPPESTVALPGLLLLLIFMMLGLAQYKKVKPS